MKITEFTRDRQVIELGAPGAVAGAMASAVQGAAGGGAPAAPAAPGAPAPAPTMGGGAQDPQQLQKMAAASAVQMAERKKQIQDDIKAKQQEIQDLQKELATIK
jgi:hypothetical protein